MEVSYVDGGDPVKAKRAERREEVELQNAAVAALRARFEPCGDPRVGRFDERRERRDRSRGGDRLLRSSRASASVNARHASSAAARVGAESVLRRRFLPFVPGT